MPDFSRLALTVCYVFAAGIAAQSAPANAHVAAAASADIVIHELAADTYMLEGVGGNIGILIGANGVFMIDSQFATATDDILEAIASLTGHGVTLLLNTHYHRDHVGGNSDYAALGATLIAHENVRVQLEQQPGTPVDALPDHTYVNSVTVRINGVTTRLLHSPTAHTNGDTLVQLVERDVIHAGDVYRNSSYPPIDTDTGGTYAGMIDGANLILALSGPRTVIIPGHGVLANKGMVRDYRDMLVLIRYRIRVRIENGWSLEQILADDITAEFDEDWAPPPDGIFTRDTLVTLMYLELLEV